MERKLRVTVWNENVHERELAEVRAIYPDGIHGCIRQFLEAKGDMEVTCVTLDMPQQGITEELLANTDVLIWWSHARQEEITEQTCGLVKKHVLMGMGLIALHSAHYSRIMRELLGTGMTLHWRHDDFEKLWCVAPSHPIAKGIPACIEIPGEEMYGEYFDIPKPDDVVFIGSFSRGEVFRSGCTFERGYGKIFFFQPGHETCPTYHMPAVQDIIANAVRWAAPVNRLSKPLENCEETGLRRGDF